MSFTIPNVQDATYPHQARPYETDYLILGAGAGGQNGTVSGCGVTQLGSPAMGVTVASGRVVVAGVGVNVTGDDLVVTDADVSSPRWDLVVADDTGTLDVVAGTAAASPVTPDIPASSVVLAAVYVPAGDTAITNVQIVDKRVFVPEPLGATGWTTITASDQATDGTRSNTATLAADSQLVFAMSANTVYRIRAHVDWLTGATTSGVKYGFTLPSSPTSVRIRAMRDGNASGSDYTGMTYRKHTAAETSGVTISTAPARLVSLDLEGEIHNGANAGNFSLTWAQVTAISENTIRYNGSYLEHS